MRSRFPVAVHLLFIRGDKILLLRRFNTGWQDGNYSLPAGHVDAGETVTMAAVREAKEEVGVTLNPGDIGFVHVMHRKSEEERIDFFHLVKHWAGEIVNAEPDKCDNLDWFSMAALPDNTIPYVEQALLNYQRGVLFSEFGW